MQSVRDPDLGLEEIIGMVQNDLRKTFSERLSVTERSKESYRKVRSSGREPRTDNMRESAMTFTCHNCKKSGKDCKQLMDKSDKPSHVENGTKKWCSYHHSNGHSNEICYQQQ